jgi:hypothetical protein
MQSTQLQILLMNLTIGNSAYFQNSKFIRFVSSSEFLKISVETLHACRIHHFENCKYFSDFLKKGSIETRESNRLFAKLFYISKTRKKLKWILQRDKQERTSFHVFIVLFASMCVGWTCWAMALHKEVRWEPNISPKSPISTVDVSLRGKKEKS